MTKTLSYLSSLYFLLELPLVQKLSPKNLVTRKAREKMPNDVLLEQTHVLDIDREGHIHPHVDSVKFVGRGLAGFGLIVPLET